MANKKLPDRIFVSRIEDGRDTFYAADERLDQIDPERAGTVVGVYILKSEHRLEVTKTLVPK